MKIAFRTDASLSIGTGHLMRCLTLADAFAAKGTQCRFLVRAHPGHMAELIRQRGFGVDAFAAGAGARPARAAGAPAHADWLGCNWETDAQESREALADWQPDWLVVDHYALDRRWEQALRPSCDKLMVIDDLADRPHDCEVLLDQNLGRQAADYAPLVPPHCRVLSGPSYALLRPEFSLQRAASIARRHRTAIGRVLVTMGGVDQFDATGAVLRALAASALPPQCRISVVMGLHAPWLDEVRALARDMPWPCEVMVNVNNMAELMAASDFAVGAAGSTSWERCCLALPAMIVVLAANQLQSAGALQIARAARLIGSVDDIARELPLAVAEFADGDRLRALSESAGAITDGLGVARLLAAMGAMHE